MTNKPLEEDPIALREVLLKRKAQRTRALATASKNGDAFAVMAAETDLMNIEDALDTLSTMTGDSEEPEAPPMEPEEEEAPEMEFGEPEMDPEAPAPYLEDDAIAAVAMSTKLRREMGDLAADVLDEYALEVHQKIQDIFDVLRTKTLNVDNNSTLRDTLLAEVGIRGVAKIQPHFENWRAALVKNILKEINTIFEVEKEEEPEPMVVVQIPAAKPKAQAKAQVAPSTDMDAEFAAVAMSLPPAPEAPAKRPLAEASPIFTTGTGVSGRVSVRAKDFRPAGQKPVVLE